MNIFAHTAATGAGYPEFISVNDIEGAPTDGPYIRISVRSPAKADGSCGDQSYIDLTLDQALELGRDLARHCA